MSQTEFSVTLGLLFNSLNIHSDISGDGDFHDFTVCLISSICLVSLLVCFIVLPFRFFRCCWCCWYFSVPLPLSLFILILCALLVCCFASLSHLLYVLRWKTYSLSKQIASMMANFHLCHIVVPSAINHGTELLSAYICMIMICIYIPFKIIPLLLSLWLSDLNFSLVFSFNTRSTFFFSRANNVRRSVGLSTCTTWFGSRDFTFSVIAVTKSQKCLLDK